MIILCYWLVLLCLWRNCYDSTCLKNVCCVSGICVFVCVFLGNIRPAEDIMADLQYILADKSAAPSHPVGYLTSENRDVWSTVREKLASAGLYNYCLSFLSLSISLYRFGPVIIIIIICSNSQVSQKCQPYVHSHFRTICYWDFGCVECSGHWVDPRNWQTHNSCHGWSTRDHSPLSTSFHCHPTGKCSLFYEHIQIWLRAISNPNCLIFSLRLCASGR